MEAAILEQPKTVRPRAKSARSMPKSRVDTLEKFLRWKPEDGYKYEWDNGQIEKSPKVIIPANFYIVQRLQRLFQKTRAFEQGAELFTEPGTKTSPTQLRIPDMGFYTATQIKQARTGAFPMPGFAIEFVSDNDTYKKCLKKVDEYFGAGAQIVWLVLPEMKLIYVYSSPEEVVICRGSRICSAEPVVPGFAIPADKLFE